jgi:hypothetical protein
MLHITDTLLKGLGMIVCMQVHLPAESTHAPVACIAIRVCPFHTHRLANKKAGMSSNDSTVTIPTQQTMQHMPHLLEQLQHAAGLHLLRQRVVRQLLLASFAFSAPHQVVRPCQRPTPPPSLLLLLLLLLLLRRPCCLLLGALCNACS